VPSTTATIFILRILQWHVKNEEGAERKCNFEKFSWKKKAIFKKILYSHHLVAIEEQIRVFLGLACKKNSLCAVGEGT
jgi:hypothetical protein